MRDTYLAFFVLKSSCGASRFFQHRDTLTLHEFKALCDRLMPGIGVCAWKWGAELLDARGNLRNDVRAWL
jgi:hypothetical protein